MTWYVYGFCGNRTFATIVDNSELDVILGRYAKYTRVYRREL